jgi:prepilin-type N-terminal cleavage/methylation domain-containing protein
VLFLSPLKSIKERQVGWWINAVGDQKIKKKRKILEMKNMKKKGFTLVELVIVIAVIAILAGVLIGTFSTVITRANQSKALQLLRTEITEIEMVHAMSGYVM